MPDAPVERGGPLLVVTMNRPHRKNAQSGGMLVCADLKAMAADTPQADTGVESRAEILLAGMHITAQEAVQWGLAGRVVPGGRALATAKEVVGVTCDNGPLAVEARLTTLHDTDGMEEGKALETDKPYGNK
jgi:enoyl-CoA hydratase/carnithine racemase